MPIPIQDDLSGSHSAQYDELLKTMEKFCTDQLPILKITPSNDTGRFTQTEVHALKKRDFRTRIFFSNTSIDGNNAWIRTHHNDVAMREHIDYVREYFEAAYTAENHIAAKGALTGIMDTIFNMDTREYFNFATVLASGLSHEANYTSFEVSEELLKGGHDVFRARTMARRRLTMLMNIVFGKITTKKFLDSHCNIFRLVHAQTKGRRNKNAFIFVVFSFLLQSCLGIFVIAQVLTDSEKKQDPNLEVGLYILASLGSLFSFSSTLPEILNFWTIFSIYGQHIGPIYLIDVFVNLVIPMSLVVAGFWIVTLQADYINGVIMTTALLFIPEIDDQLPRLLGFDQSAIIENFLISEAKLAYNKYTTITDKEVDMKFNLADIEKQHRSGNCELGVDFGDFFITNSVLEGSDSHDFGQPFSIKVDAVGHELDPSNYITEDCLLRTVEWRFMDSHETHPTVGYLRLTKMRGDVVEIDFRGVAKVERGRVNRVDGAFIITNFVMTSACIESLRLAGSENENCFLTALEHYSLWDLTPNARKLLKKAVGNPVKCRCH